jgi:flagellar biosynthesis GTPase FlhF
MADNSKNFIYLLPDVAYIVELVKAKDSEAFKISDYLQVNGSFMNDNEILEESVKKLSGRIKEKEYELVLPDFLFTNTVINVEESGEDKILAHVNEKVIPDLSISDKTHELHTFVLNEFKGQAKVQISALEKTVLQPLQEVFADSGNLKIDKVYPLSWVTKSLISLEPSISVIQMGANLYMAQHYIGIDQANNSKVEDVEKIVESIKTLKGAEPSIQTVYLLANALVEGKLGDGLKGTLPVQQLAKESEDSEMPSYIKQVIEAAVKTVEIKEYKAPGFNFIIGDSVVTAKENKEEENKEDQSKEKKEEKKEDDVVLPPPTEIGTSADETTEEGSVEDKKEEEKEDSKEEVKNEVEKKPTEEEKKEDQSKEEPKEEVEEEPTKEEVEEKPTKEEVEEKPTKEEEKEELKEEKKEDSTPVAQVDLRQFMSDEASNKEEPKKEEEKKDEKPEVKDEKKIIKNDAGVNNMVKMVFVALVSFFITVGIGLGIGLGFLTFTNKQQTAGESQPTPVAEVSPSPEPTIEPTLSPVDRETYAVLVVNATTQAGYAGKIATALEDAGFTDVEASNAKGDYDEGNFVLSDEEDLNLIKTLEEDTDLSIEFLAEKEVEDPSGDYDFVIVLAE